MGRVSKTLTRLLGCISGDSIKGRRVDVFPDDVFIVSYPKSGNTWVRFVLSNLVSENESQDFATVERSVPDIYRFSNRRLRQQIRPRVLKSHEYLDPRYGKMIYLFRDPRAVAVSYYHHCARKGWLEPGIGLDAFLDIYLVGRLDSYGSWADHVGGWLGARRGRNDFLPIDYETMYHNAEATFRRIVKFIGLEVTDVALRAALAASSAEAVNMKVRNSGEPFVRSRSLSDWRRELSREQVSRIEAKFSSAMRDCGYLEAVDGGF